MNGSTSIGPDQNSQMPGQDQADGAPAVEVDAQNANERDMQKGLAGAETKLPQRSPHPQVNPEKDDKMSERNNPGMTGGSGQTGRDTPQGT